MSNVVVFGIRDLASLAHYYLHHDSQHRVVAFTVDEAYLPAEPSFEGLPVVPFSDLPRSFPPSSYRVFTPMTHRNMNRDRAQVFGRIHEAGYRHISFVHTTSQIAHGVRIGSNCFVLENCIVQPFVKLGDNSVVWSGSYIGHHSTIGDHVFIASHVVVSGHCTVEPYSFIGVNAAIRDGVTIGEGCFVAMSACVTKSTDPWCSYRGIPATTTRSQSR